jgi:hypothetical protein
VNSRLFKVGSSSGPRCSWPAGGRGRAAAPQEAGGVPPRTAGGRKERRDMRYSGRQRKGDEELRPT